MVECAYCGRKNEYKFGFGELAFCDIGCLNSYQVRCCWENPVLNQVLRPINEEICIALTKPVPREINMVR